MTSTNLLTHPFFCTHIYAHSNNDDAQTPLESFAFELPHIGKNDIAILHRSPASQPTNFIAIRHRVEVSPDDHWKVLGRVVTQSFHEVRKCVYLQLPNM